MGVSFSVPEMKVKLQSTVYRCDRQINKRTNQLKVQRRTIANLLSEGKDEPARIHVESVLREEKTILALEHLKVMCMLVTSRIHTIGNRELQTQDVLESLAGLIYARVRLPELRELDEICAMLGAKFGSQFVETHQANREYKVPPALVTLLEYKVPTLDVVFNTLNDIATEYSVTWTPKIANPSNFYDPNAIGAIVSLDPVPAPGPNSGSAPHPGPGPAPMGGMGPNSGMPMPMPSPQQGMSPGMQPSYDGSAGAKMYPPAYAEAAPTQAPPPDYNPQMPSNGYSGYPPSGSSGTGYYG